MTEKNKSESFDCCLKNADWNGQKTNLKFEERDSNSRLLFGREKNRMVCSSMHILIILNIKCYVQKCEGSTLGYRIELYSYRQRIFTMISYANQAKNHNWSRNTREIHFIHVHVPIFEITFCLKIMSSEPKIS